MKTTLTIQESAELIKRGVSANKASGTYIGRWEHSSEGSFPDPDSVEPLFTLADLLSLLPKSIEYEGYAEAKLNIYTRPHRRECWVAKYIVSAKTIPYDGAGEELIDALYEVLWKLLDNHVKLD